MQDCMRAVRDVALPLASLGLPRKADLSTISLVCRINDTIGLLRQKMPDTHLLMLGILPRGDGTNSSTTYRWPGIYTPAISSVNDWLIELSEKEDMISYLDCGPMLLYNGQASLYLTLPKWLSSEYRDMHLCQEDACNCTCKLIRKLLRRGVQGYRQDCCFQASWLTTSKPCRLFQPIKWMVFTQVQLEC